LREANRELGYLTEEFNHYLRPEKMTNSETN